MGASSSNPNIVITDDEHTLKVNDEDANFMYYITKSTSPFGKFSMLMESFSKNRFNIVGSPENSSSEEDTDEEEEEEEEEESIGKNSDEDVELNMNDIEKNVGSSSLITKSTSTLRHRYAPPPYKNSFVSGFCDHEDSLPTGRSNAWITIKSEGVFELYKLWLAMRGMDGMFIKSIQDNFVHNNTHSLSKQPSENSNISAEGIYRDIFNSHEKKFDAAMRYFILVEKFIAQSTISFENFLSYRNIHQGNYTSKITELSVTESNPHPKIDSSGKDEELNGQGSAVAEIREALELMIILKEIKKVKSELISDLCEQKSPDKP